jgi:mannosyltransferase
VSTVPAADPSRVRVRDIEVIAPNLKKRLSGVTSTIIALVPFQARKLGIASFGGGLPESLPRLRLWQLPGLWLRPRSGRPRIWHARRNTEMATGLILSRVLRMPMKLVFTSAAQRHHRSFTRWLIRRMDAVIATSVRSGSFLRVPHTVIMHGIDLNNFTPGDQGSRPSGEHLVGCFGRVRHQKGTDLYVKALIDLLPRYPLWSAVISGRVTAEHQGFAAELQRQIDEAGLTDRIRFLGEVPDITPWYRKVSLYVAPSRNEGFGLTPLEAMASGTAVVASDAGAYAEMIEPGVTGEVTPAGDGGALRDAIEIYLRDPELALRHGENGLARVRRDFPLDREARQIQEVYDAVWERFA